MEAIIKGNTKKINRDKFIEDMWQLKEKHDLKCDIKW